jgi:hypothetical protein
MLFIFFSFAGKINHVTEIQNMCLCILRATSLVVNTKHLLQVSYLVCVNINVWFCTVNTYSVSFKLQGEEFKI